jgi:hypothetical protein
MDEYLYQYSIRLSQNSDLPCNAAGIVSHLARSAGSHMARPWALPISDLPCVHCGNFRRMDFVAANHPCQMAAPDGPHGQVTLRTRQANWVVIGLGRSCHTSRVALTYTLGGEPIGSGWANRPIGLFLLVTMSYRICGYTTRNSRQMTLYLYAIAMNTLAIKTWIGEVGGPCWAMRLDGRQDVHVHIVIQWELINNNRMSNK